MLKTKVRLRITEVNQSRRRVVGSIRSVSNEERREKIEQIWNEIEVGKKYEGVVKSMTSYGAFVDIGGIDGMIHVSELSWTRIHQPSDILKIGDKIEVYVIGFDKEKKKISLGYKTKESNPWQIFIGSYKVGDTATVKVVKLMPFGAFAEILPGVDGLIHISQITDHRIGQPSEVLSEGTTVDAKITDIDMEKQKVPLAYGL
jgi:4-hydroxy-3-methylbut-2-enyl diphosphate reductase